ncbi:hypothetical protein [Euzebya rosea]|uniref:hypothetical protein n=1 Tax=Euzebya rosea TaxID=2052804 RepID=UPI000D3E6F20|nr:hypothetical protein [Euzebya rosea]
MKSTVRLHLQVVRFPGGDRGPTLLCDLLVDGFPRETAFCVSVSREPVGFGHSLHGLLSGTNPTFRFPQDWHPSDALKAGRYTVRGTVHAPHGVLESSQSILIDESDLD